MAHATWHHSSPPTNEQQLLLSPLKLFYQKAHHHRDPPAGTLSRNTLCLSCHRWCTPATLAPLPRQFSLVFLAYQFCCICDTESLHLGYISKPISARIIRIAWTPATTTSPPLQASTLTIASLGGSHALSTIVSPGGPMLSRLELASRPRASQQFLVSVFCVYHGSGQVIAPCLTPEQWVFWGCSISANRAQVASLLEWALDYSHLCCKQTDNCHRTEAFPGRTSQTCWGIPHSKGILKAAVGPVPTSQARSLCPLKCCTTDSAIIMPTQEAHQYLSCTSNSAIITPTQEAHQYSCCTTNSAIITPTQEAHQYSCCTTNSAIITPTQEAHQYTCCITNSAIIAPHSRGKLTLPLRPLLPSQLLSSCRPKRHTEPCHGTPPTLGAHSTLYTLKRQPLLVAWKLSLSFYFSSLCYLCRPSALLCFS